MPAPSRFRIIVCGIVLTLLPAAGVWGQAQEFSRERLQGLLERFPDADANRDGTLTEAEARTYAATNLRASPAPTHPDVSYGLHARNVLDFWRARSATPTPVVIYIHGGGFVSGDKSGVRRDRLIRECLDAGVSFAAINYRFLAPGVAIQDILRDCARAVQFIRAKAEEWNVDKARIASYGGSAGAGASLWLAFHDDLADPTSPDPVLRESTRLACAGSNQGQFSYDFPKWREVFGAEAVERFGGRYRLPENYGFTTIEELNSPAGRRVRADCDIIDLISKDDPPIFISSTLPDLSLENTNQFLHHPKHSQLLWERLRETGVPLVATIPALKITPPRGGPADWREFVFQHLQVGEPHAAAAP